MSHRTLALFGSLLAAAAVVAVLPAQAQTRPAAGGAVKNSPPKFVPVTYSDLPGWQQDDHPAALKTFLKSCDVIIAASKSANKGGAAPTTPALLSACDEGLRLNIKSLTATGARSFFETHFTPHRIEHNSPAGLLTGYYEPVIAGSRKPTLKFSIPIHTRPPDLVNLVEESQRGAKDGTLTHARKTATGTEPYATRAEIEQGALQGKGLELMYLTSSVDAFFMQIQGSGRIKLPDGSMVRVSYDGKNGHPTRR